MATQIFLCSSLCGERIQFDEHIFQMGWLGHQLELRVETPPKKLRSRILLKTKKNQKNQTKKSKEERIKLKTQKKQKNNQKKKQKKISKKKNQILGLADSPLGCSAGSVSVSCLGRSSKSKKCKKPQKQIKK